MYSAKAVPVFCAIFGLLVKFCYFVGVSEKLMWQEASGKHSCNDKKYFLCFCRFLC